MKKIVLVASVLVALISCNSLEKDEYLITGTAKGIANGKKVLVQIQDENGIPKSIDTVTVKDGKFEIKGKTKEVTVAYVSFPDLKNDGFTVILEPGEIDAEVYKDSIDKSKVTGTYNNDELTKTLKITNKIDAEMQKIGMEFQNKNMQRIQQAQQTRDTAVMNQLNAEFLPILKDKYKFYFDYIEKNPKSYLSLLYFNKLSPFATTEPDRIKKLFNNLDPSIKNSTIGKKLGEAINKMPSKK
jgi:hypothetical protein